MLISTNSYFRQKKIKLINFGIMMQGLIFLSTFLKRGIKSFNKMVLFPYSCIIRFLKAIVFLNKKVITFFMINENQHYLSKMLVFFCSHHNIKYKQLLTDEKGSDINY